MPNKGEQGARTTPPKHQIKMKVSDFLNKKAAAKAISFEVLPPLKGNGTAQLFRTIDRLREFCPNYINITTHNSEFVYRQLDNGQYERDRIRRRPGTIAIAAAIQQRYGIPVIPHIICSGATIESIEYELLDLQFLGIQNLLLLRGDKARDEQLFTPTPNGHTHTTDLIEQVNRFNDGFFADGTAMKHPGESFEYGVACYPEKHEEAPNLDMDIDYLLKKQQLGAKYAVTQLFYDNQKYFDFVEKARQKGVTIPIVPGIKPFAKLYLVHSTATCLRPWLAKSLSAKPTTMQRHWAWNGPRNNVANSMRKVCPAFTFTPYRRSIQSAKWPKNCYELERRNRARRR